MDFKIVIFLLYTHITAYLCGFQWADWRYDTVREKITASILSVLWPLVIIAWLAMRLWGFLDKYLLLKFNFNLLFRPEKYKKAKEQLDSLKDDYERHTKPFVTKSGSEIWVKANRDQYIYMMAFRVNGADLFNYNQNQQQ